MSSDSGVRKPAFERSSLAKEKQIDIQVTVLTGKRRQDACSSNQGAALARCPKTGLNCSPRRRS